MGLADELRQQQQHSMAMSEELISTLRAVEQQLAKLTTAVEKQNGFLQTSDEVISTQIASLATSLESISQHFATGSVSTPNSAINEKKLTEIERTLTLLAGLLDVKSFVAAASLLQSTTTELTTTTRWSAEQAKQQAQEVEKIGAGAKIMILQGRDLAVQGIQDAANAAAEIVTARLDETTDRAQHVVTVAERLERRLGWAAAGRMALALVPLATTLLMLVTSIWALVHGARWVIDMQVDLWLQIVTGTALTGVLIGAVFGIWRATIWIRSKLP